MLAAKVGTPIESADSGRQSQPQAWATHEAQHGTRTETIIKNNTANPAPWADGFA